MSEFDHRFSSGEDAHRERVTVFFRAVRKTCSCRCFELRQECGHLLCACGAPLTPREVAA